MTRRYTERDADRDALLLELVDARAEFARVAIMRQSMNASETWRRLMHAATLRLEAAAEYCDADCVAPLKEVDDELRAVESRARR